MILTTTHRVNYSIAQWKEIFATRGLLVDSLSKINSKTRLDQLPDRGTEIREWVATAGANKNYVIIDDDRSINALPNNIKDRWVQTNPLIGFDKACLHKAIHILTH